MLAACTGCGGATSVPRSEASAAPERPRAAPARPPFVTPVGCTRERRPLACLLSDGLPLAKPTSRAEATAAMNDAVKALGRRCRENDQDACARSASLLLVFSELSSKENASDKAPTGKQGLELLRTACELGESPLGCYVLATLTREGEHAAKDPSRALQYFAKACDGGLAAGCYGAGEMHENADTPSADAAEAMRLMARGCELGSPFACTYEGFARAGGRGGRVDNVAAAALFLRACDGGDDDGCGGLGVLLVRGEGVKPDVPRGLALVKAACAHASVWSCARLPDLGPAASKIHDEPVRNDLREEAERR